MIEVLSEILQKYISRILEKTRGLYNIQTTKMYKQNRSEVVFENGIQI